MSEELLQRDLLKNPAKIGKWDFYIIGATTIKALKEYGIIRNVDYGDVDKKKVYGIIVLRKNVIAIIEYKQPSEFNTKAKQDKAIRQEIEVAKKLGCKLIIATDTKESVWVNALTGKRIKDDKNAELKVNFDPHNVKMVSLIESVNYSINELNNSIKPKQLVNPTDLAKQIWQDIWSVSGESPTNCLYSFVELFIFKYLSDLGVLGQGVNFDHLMERFSYDIENPDEEALEYYAKNIRPKIKELFPKNSIDNTTIINGTVFINKDQQAVKGYSTVFKRALNRFKNYGKLEHIDYDFKSHLFESFLKEGISKKNLGQYFTPLRVVRAIVEMAKDNIQKGIKICDPACGVGKFLLEPVITKLDYFYDVNKNGINPTITIHGFDKGFDNEEQKTIILAKANMLIYFSDLVKDNPGLTKEFAKLFNESFTLKTNSILGTLSMPVEEEYDLILTNPPYVTSGSSNLKDEIKKDRKLKDYYKISALGIEGLFMEWIIRALKPGGKAFVVIPDGMLNRLNDKNLRRFIVEECFIDGLISLPLNTFFTTNKKTYILCISKKENKNTIQDEPIFTYLVSEIGETRDTYRFDIDQNDLTEAVVLFSFFKGNKQGFAKINTDNRCKIVPSAFFRDNVDKNWIIDNLWTEEEKIRLGITEKNEDVSISDFSSMMEDLSMTINGLQDEIKELTEQKDKSTIGVAAPLYKEVAIINDEFFELRRGKRITKKTIDLHKGNIPVYSSSKEESSILGLIDESYLKKCRLILYDKPSILFNLDGSVGYCFLRADEKYSFIDVVASLRPKNDRIDLAFLLFELRICFEFTYRFF
jgi:type I restriction-modification system DNA methylase subunit